MKCKSCNEDKPLDQFYTRKSGNPNSKCKECVKAYTKQHYEANKKVYIDRAIASRPATLARWREFVHSLKLACSECGEDHPAVLDFHHTDPSVKEDHPSQIRSRKRLLKEIETCIVLCSNCHRKLHWQEKQELKLK